MSFRLTWIVLIHMMLLFAASGQIAWAEEQPPWKVTSDVVYGHKDGLALTYDVFEPESGGLGKGIIFVVSGGWYSVWSPPEKMHWFVDPLIEKGFTVFTVRHGSSPKYGIPDAVADVRQSVRHIRLHATRFQIDPLHIGVYGMSAGGHLSLVLGTTGDDGNKSSDNPLEQTSDRVQAVVAFVPPTDLTIMVHEAPNRLPAYKDFPALTLDMPQAEAYSPLRHVTADDAPILLLSGAKDDLVPIDHSRRLRDALVKQSLPHKLVEFPEAGHGFPPADQKTAFAEMIAWFQTHLSPP